MDKNIHLHNLSNILKQRNLFLTLSLGLLFGVSRVFLGVIFLIKTCWAPEPRHSIRGEAPGVPPRLLFQKIINLNYWRLDFEILNGLWPRGPLDIHMGVYI